MKTLLLMPALLLLTACGQKGPLFLPDPSASPVILTPAPQDAQTPPAPDRSEEPRKQIH
jgi:predicted small lipoprotein YifL